MRNYCFLSSGYALRSAASAVFLFYPYNFNGAGNLHGAIHYTMKTVNVKRLFLIFGLN